MAFFNVFLSRNHSPEFIRTIEPDPRTEGVLKKNCRIDTEIIMAAVVSNGPETIPLFLGKTFSATNSIEKFRGRTSVDVTTIDFKEVIKDIDFIKCDCEGGEYSINWNDLPERIETIAIEFHFNRPHWEDQMREIDESLLGQGFVHVKKPKVNNFQKINTGLYVRDHE